MSMITLRPIVASLLLCTVLPGCTTLSQHNSKSPELDVPQHWQGASSNTSSIDEQWLSDLNDPALTSLIHQSLGDNFDLRAAAARVEAARAQAIVSGADRLPQISGSINASRSKRNSTSGLAISATRNTNYQTELEVSWEADIWGRLSNQARAAALDFQVSEAEFRAARLSLAANIARTWFDAIEATLQVELSERTVKNFEDNLVVIEEGFRAGISSALDVRLARANVATAVSQLQVQKARLDAANRSLQILVGRYPVADVELPGALPQLPQVVPAGLPSQLLARRPDLVAAKLRLAAADERVNQAQKALLPSFRLTASSGSSSSELRDLLDMDAIIWSLASNIAAPIFQGGRLKANIKIAEANSVEGLANYAQAILQAFREVETALTAGELLTKQEEALRIAAEESQEAEHLAFEQYREGLVDIVTLLESQRRSFDAQSNLIQVTDERLQNRIDLYLALGGEFMDPELALSTNAENLVSQPSE